MCPLAVCLLSSAASLAGFRRLAFRCVLGDLDRRQPSVEPSLSAGARHIQTIQALEYC
jgi:hypothetical protein